MYKDANRFIKVWEDSRDLAITLYDLECRHYKDLEIAQKLEYCQKALLEVGHIAFSLASKVKDKNEKL